MTGVQTCALPISPMFIAALFIIARTWKQPRCPSANEWIRKLWCIFTMEYYSAIKKNTFESVLIGWMKLEPIIQSEVSQKEKRQYSMLLLLLLSRFSHVRLSEIPRTVPYQAPLSIPFSSKNTGVGSCSLLQGIFLIQGLNLCLMSATSPGEFFITSATW